MRFWFGVWGGFVGFFVYLFLIEGQGMLTLISTSQQVGEIFMNTMFQIFSPRFHLTNF